MMKKLLVLMLVLAMGGLASAGLSLDEGLLLSNNQVVIVLEAGSSNLISYDLEVRIDAGSFGSAGANINPSGHVWMLTPKIDKDLAQLFRITAGDIVMFGGPGLAAPSQLLTGLIVTGATEYTVSLWSHDAVDAAGENELGELDSVFIPEPMSLMLLGLGGLFLRKRK